MPVRCLTCTGPECRGQAACSSRPPGVWAASLGALGIWKAPGGWAVGLQALPAGLLASPSIILCPGSSPAKPRL